ncbi:hypothetical protein [Streptomyces sp. PH10-H1]|uniref:hypothetical protein n=1 Tax=Streptomyces sp. PH10-H1 TaxID=3046212 RepID=UPI0024BADC39|nr:hypothetical protein [Streptomyces sp. PH10-H1]MDJ0347506.1 hypothetical protein [Streptomyces sp. PH10-H1]
MVQELVLHDRSDPVGGVSAAAVEQLSLGRVDAGLAQEVVEHGEAVLTLVAARRDGHQADREVRSEVVADLQDQLGVLGVDRGDVGRDALRAVVGAPRRTGSVRSAGR